MKSSDNVRQTLLDLEKEYWQAMKDGNTGRLVELADDPCTVASASGVASVPRDRFLEMVENGSYTLESFEIGDDAEVRMLSDDIGVVAYRVEEKVTVDGKLVTMNAAETSTWVRRDGHWVCAVHTESIHGDPFGRDRKKAPAGKATQAGGARRS